MLQFTGLPVTGFGLGVLVALQLVPLSAPRPLQLTIPLPGGQSIPVGGSRVLSRWRPRRPLHSHTLYILRTASGRLDGHNSDCVVGAFLWILLYEKAPNYTAIPCCRAVPLMGPQGGVRNIPWKLQEVWTTPAPSVALFVPCQLALYISKSPSIVGLLSPKYADDFVGQGRVTGVPQLNNRVPMVG